MNIFRHGSRGVIIAALAWLGAGCTCGAPGAQPTNQCADVPGVQADRPHTCGDDSECAPQHFCRTSRDRAEVRCCVRTLRPCATEADCCPGQICPAARRECLDKALYCDAGADCGDRGDRVCEPSVDAFGSSSRCRFRRCGENGACPEGQGCFNGECMAGLPCSSSQPPGTCPSGHGCVPTTNQCQNYTNPTDRSAAACPMTCRPGFLATFADPRNLWDACLLSEVRCVCAELPGLWSNDLGRFSALAADPGQSIFTSAYDGRFGDLVVARYDLSGRRQTLEYVDGVPVGKPIVYGPSGPRGGQVEPGADVGRYTDIAVNQRRIYVSYYDVTNGDLKLASKAPGTEWSVHRVDGANADLGLYTSVAVDADGRPGISYFQRAGEPGFDTSECPAPSPTGAKSFITALKFARAKSAVPRQESDWVVRTLACLSTAPVCASCSPTEVCADLGTGAGPSCYSAATGCSRSDGGTGCDPTHTCVTVNGQSRCALSHTTAATPLAEVPPGVGVFTSLAFRGNEAVIAYMRRSPARVAPSKAPADGDLYGVTVSAAGVASAPVLLDALGDTGYFPDVKVEPGSGALAVSYHDLSTKALKFSRSAQLQPSAPEVIDNGFDPRHPGEQHFVGADGALVFGSSPTELWAVYQDATSGDLRLAKRATRWQVQPPVATAGAVGFFADAVLEGGKLYASHARVRAKMVGNVAEVDNGLLLEVLTPP